ncbi:hypothetical protein CRUP_022849 [Coryphaenoides rupestris]|nr:hypothetical protein CRUP_022849 [Coryphaenoides rupestris]
MGFFKSFQQNLPTVNITSLLDSVSTIISKAQDQEVEGEDGEEVGSRRAGSKGNQQGEAGSSSAAGGGAGNGAGDGENVGSNSQLEWEWRDGCWRVKQTDAELAEEEQKKAEQQAWQEEKERKRRERRARQQEKEAAESRSLQDTIEGEEEGGEERHNNAEQSAKETPEKGARTKKEEEGAHQTARRTEIPRRRSLRSRCQPGTTNTSSPPTKRATAVRPLVDRDTPERLSHSGSRTRSGRRGGGGGGRRGGSGGRDSSPERCSSEASVDQDTESYLNKGYEEDVPSDSTAVLGPEDGSGPRLPALYEPEPLAKYGTLDVAFEYDATQQWLAVTVTAATDIPAPRQVGNVAWQVHLVLLPTKKQRAKTGVQRGPCPVFTETFKFSRLAREVLGDHAVRFRLYSVQRMKKERVLGEKVFYLDKLNLQGKMALPGCGSLVSVSRSAGALSYRSTGESCAPEILLGLVYNAATGRLSAEVIQGSHFKTAVSDKPAASARSTSPSPLEVSLSPRLPPSSPPPDTYVKLSMLDSKGKEMSKCKTAVCRGQPNPTYKESFVFQVALFQLSEVSLLVSVFCRRSSMRPREQLGWVSLGQNSTGEEQEAHWGQMKEAEGQQVCHWHVLTDT